MAVIALDTSAYSGFRRGLPALKRHFTHHDTLLVPLIVLGELRAGFAAGTQQAQNEHLLQEFLDLPNVDTVDLTDATTHRYGDIFAHLRAAGKPIGVNDMWIAALAMEQGIPLLTLDADFANIAGLKLIKL